MENEEKMEIIAKTEATPLQILITDADKYGTDIAAMSNFFDGYINQLSTELRTNATAELMVNLPVADFLFPLTFQLQHPRPFRNTFHDN